MHSRDVCVAQAAGSSMSQQQRTQIDAVIAHIASTAGLAIDQISQSFEGNSSQAGTVAIQLAALKALLASVLCPALHRPSFLPQALTLFTQVRTATAIEMMLLGVSTTSSWALLPCQACAVIPGIWQAGVLLCIYYAEVMMHSHCPGSAIYSRSSSKPTCSISTESVQSFIRSTAFWRPQSIAYTDGCLHAGLAVISAANSCLQPTSSSGFGRHHTPQSKTHHLPITQGICKHAPLHLLKHQHRPHHRPGRPKALVSCHASLTFYPATHRAAHCCISSGC